MFEQSFESSKRDFQLNILAFLNKYSAQSIYILHKILTFELLYDYLLKIKTL